LLLKRIMEIFILPLNLNGVRKGNRPGKMPSVMPV